MKRCLPLLCLFLFGCAVAGGSGRLSDGSTYRWQYGRLGNMTLERAEISGSANGYPAVTIGKSDAQISEEFVELCNKILSMLTAMKGTTVNE